MPTRSFIESKGDSDKYERFRNQVSQGRIASGIKRKEKPILGDKMLLWQELNKMKKDGIDFDKIYEYFKNNLEAKGYTWAIIIQWINEYYKRGATVLKDRKAHGRDDPR